MLFRGLGATLALWAVGAVLLRATIAPPHTCPDVTPDDLRFAASQSAAWIERALNPDGTYVYEYSRAGGPSQAGYNEVRHAGVTMSLYQYAAITGDLSVVDTADAALQRMIAISIEHDDWMAIQDPRTGSVQLGAASLMLAGMAQRRLATGDTSYDEVMRRVGRFLLVMQRPDGSFLNFWIPSQQRPDPTYTSRYATGEAFWALTLMHEAFPGEGWDEPARAVAEYLARYRDEAEGFEFPPWADQWAAYGFSEMVHWGLDQYEVDYSRSLAERFGFLIRIESGRSDNWLLKLIHGPPTRAAGHGTWVEGLASLYRVAGADERLADVRDDIGTRAICGAALLVDRQTSESAAQAYDDPALAEGAWFHDGVTRMDDQQHALSALIRTVPILEERRR